MVCAPRFLKGSVLKPLPYLDETNENWYTILRPKWDLIQGENKK